MMREAFYLDSPENYLMYLFHIATCNFALVHVIGKYILDYGYGSGYDAYHMAVSGDSIIGMDVADKVIESTKSNYRADNLAYRRVECDVILSFLVIEHIIKVAPSLSKIHRVYKPGWVFICATLDRLIYI